MRFVDIRKIRIPPLYFEKIHGIERLPVGSEGRATVPYSETRINEKDLEEIKEIIESTKGKIKFERVYWLFSKVTEYL